MLKQNAGMAIPTFLKCLELLQCSTERLWKDKNNFCVPSKAAHYALGTHRDIAWKLKP